MTISQAQRNPYAAQAAFATLESLAQCRAIDPYQDGDGYSYCANDQIELVERAGHMEHNPAAIRRLRAATYDERWPNG